MYPAQRTALDGFRRDYLCSFHSAQLSGLSEPCSEQQEHFLVAPRGEDSPRAKCNNGSSAEFVFQREIFAEVDGCFACHKSVRFGVGHQKRGIEVKTSRREKMNKMIASGWSRGQQFLLGRTFPNAEGKTSTSDLRNGLMFTCACSSLVKKEVLFTAGATSTLFCVPYPEVLLQIHDSKSLYRKSCELFGRKSTPPSLNVLVSLRRQPGMGVLGHFPFSIFFQRETLWWDFISEGYSFPWCLTSALPPPQQTRRLYLHRNDFPLHWEHLLFSCKTQTEQASCHFQNF